MSTDAKNFDVKHSALYKYYHKKGKKTMNNKKNTAPAKQEETNNTVEEKLTITVYGTVTDLMYGRRNFKNGKSDKEERYRITIEPLQGEMQKLIDACSKLYDLNDKNWLPKFMSEDATEDDMKYINQKSAFDFRIGQLLNRKTREIEEIGGVADVLEKFGNINGSDVAVKINVKKGAYYPLSVLIINQRSKTMSEYYEDSDFNECPF